MQLTKQQALSEFRYNWKEIVTHYPKLKGDTVWKREEWNNFTDMLCKNGQISDSQYNNWSNPF
ncbi:gp68 [Synechococcus phage S-CBM2]|nr:gp68 [Synechococcus phage S-CBM2]